LLWKLSIDLWEVIYKHGYEPIFSSPISDWFQQVPQVQRQNPSYIKEAILDKRLNQCSKYHYE